jgi:uncharacterized protein YbbC (DUF1343 family)
LWFVLLLAGCAAPEDAVRPGIEVLLEDSTHLIEGRRLGLLTNHTGRDRHGTADLARLLDAGAEVTAIFAPEHGYRGTVDEVLSAHGVDAATGIPIYNLYGPVTAPTDEMLRDVDALLVDLQDIGARPYTYISTALRAMTPAAANGVEVIVLDRPNPIGGAIVQGPVLDTAFRSFVGMLPVAQRHGMTLGELARLGNAHLGINADLRVIPAAGWRRHQWYDETGLPWVRPSPSMPDLESATHYPGLVWFEATNLSVGRGTAVAFQVIGAPWLDAAAVVQAVGALPGVLLSDTVVQPAAPPDGKYDGRDVTAVRLLVTDREAYDPVATAVALLATIGEIQGESLSVRPARLAQLAGSDALGEVVRHGAAWREVVAAWQEPLARFRDLRRRHLIYE